MRNIVIAGWMMVALAGAPFLQAQDMPDMPPPQKEHQWLQRFVGEWEFESEITLQPGDGPLRTSGTESVRMIGGFWIIGESHSEMMEMPFVNVITIGFDPQKRKYVGTSVDSMSSYLWEYEGTLDSAGRSLILEWEGPCHLTPGGVGQFKGVTEFKSDDHRVFTASRRGEDGEWILMMTINFTRKEQE